MYNILSSQKNSSSRSSSSRDRPQLIYRVLYTIYYNIICILVVCVRWCAYYNIYIVVPPPPPPPTRGGCRPPPPPMMCCIYARTHTLRTSPSGLLLATRSLRALSLGTAALPSPSETALVIFSDPERERASQYLLRESRKIERDRILKLYTRYSQSLLIYL